MNIFDIFARSEIVITDRLHGMIFAAITGTKCIVLNSKSPKIKGCFEWIKDLKYIYFLNEISNFSVAYNYLLDLDYADLKRHKSSNFDYGTLEQYIIKKISKINTNI